MAPEQLQRWRAEERQRQRQQLRRRQAFLQQELAAAEAAGADDGLLDSLRLLLALALREAALLDAREAADELLPAADLGQRFRQGRKRGSVSPLRLAVRRLLKKRPQASTAELWQLLKAKPPRGITLYESSRLGRYAETRGWPDTSYKRFQNIIAEERQRLK